jgi:transcriptional regulator with XRE-family HTH domain
MMLFGQRLKTAREKAGFPSAAKFAGALGMNEHAYRKYERGAASPPLDTITRICELLDVTPNYLLPIASEGRNGRNEGNVKPTRRKAAA